MCTCTCTSMHVCPRVWILWYLQLQVYICVFWANIEFCFFLKFYYPIGNNGIKSAGKTSSWLGITFRRSCPKQIHNNKPHQIKRYMCMLTSAGKKCNFDSTEKNFSLHFIWSKCSTTNVICRSLVSLNGAYQGHNKKFYRDFAVTLICFHHSLILFQIPRILARYQIQGV